MSYTKRISDKFICPLCFTMWCVACFNVTCVAHVMCASSCLMFTLSHVACCVCVLCGSCVWFAMSHVACCVCSDNLNVWQFVVALPSLCWNLSGILVRLQVVEWQQCTWCFFSQPDHMASSLLPLSKNARGLEYWSADSGHRGFRGSARMTRIIALSRARQSQSGGWHAKQTCFWIVILAVLPVFAVLAFLV